ncbi:MAG: hypothetical protein ACM3PP_08880, partial [Candidatus Saccharibacteria bacterium]
IHRHSGETTRRQTGFLDNLDVRFCHQPELWLLILYHIPDSLDRRRFQHLLPIKYMMGQKSTI